MPESTPIENAYSRHYEKKDSDKHVYPVEFVVRSFLGTYPRLKMDRSHFPGSRVLDLGFGDGRNFPLLNNLGFRISATEISEDILALARRKFAASGIELDLRVGTNSRLPFDAGYFDYVLACHAIYYVAANERFERNLAEVARVMKPGAKLVASFPKPSNYVVRGAHEVSAAHYKVAHDPLGLRNGTVLFVPRTEEHLRETLSSAFKDFVVGSMEDDFFGIQQDAWIVVATRKDAK